MTVRKMWYVLFNTLHQNKLNFPEKYWMRGEGLPNLNYYNPEQKKNVQWVPPTAKKVAEYDIPVRKG